MAVVASRSERDIKNPSIVIALVSVATVILAVRDPHGGGYGVCPILALTGYLCPTCGGLRAVHDLAHFDLAGAWALNPVLTILLPLTGIAMIVWWIRAWLGRPPKGVPASVSLVVMVILLVFGVLRNL